MSLGDQLLIKKLPPPQDLVYIRRAIPTRHRTFRRGSRKYQNLTLEINYTTPTTMRGTGTWGWA